MNPITINLNVNLPEKQAEWICSAIACLAQIIDQASRTAGTPDPPAAHAEPDVTTVQHSDALVVRPGDTLVVGEDGKLHPVSKPEPAAQTQQNAENAAETQQETEKADEPAKPQQETEKDDEPAKPQHTTKELANLVIELTQKYGKKEEAAEIVHGYAKRVSAIPEDKIDEAYKALKALQEGDDGTDA